MLCRQLRVINMASKQFATAGMDGKLVFWNL